MVFTSYIEGDFHIKNLGVSWEILLVVTVILKRENKGKNDKSKEKDHNNDRVTIAIGDDLMGNDGVTKVIDVCDICLQTNMGVQLWLRGVKYALDVRCNLISMQMLDDGGYDNHFGYGKWKLTKGNLVVARGEKISKLCWTKALVAKDSVNAMDMETPLWHRKISHISEKELNCLAKKDMLQGLKNAKLEKLYDHVEKKIVRSRDVQFMEDQTIEDIDKNGEQHNYVVDHQLGDGFDIPPDDDVEEEQEMSEDENLGDTLKLPPVQLKRSNRQRQLSTDEYVTLTDGEEP
ncbi:hypothetical protein CR513_34926, partial [Mucuna pruriens]